jgi:hypothetical protein
MFFTGIGLIEQFIFLNKINQWWNSEQRNDESGYQTKQGELEIAKLQIDLQKVDVEFH